MESKPNVATTNLIDMENRLVVALSETGVRVVNEMNERDQKYTFSVI